MSANTHHTKLKGDIAVAAVILNLTKKGYIVSEPMSENAPYDLICDTGNKLLKIQVKYRKDGVIPYRTSWADKNGTPSDLSTYCGVAATPQVIKSHKSSNRFSSQSSPLFSNTSCK